MDEGDGVVLVTKLPPPVRHFERTRWLSGAMKSRTRKLSEAKSVYIDLSIPLRSGRDDAVFY